MKETQKPWLTLVEEVPGLRLPARVSKDYQLLDQIFLETRDPYYWVDYSTLNNQQWTHIDKPTDLYKVYINHFTATVMIIHSYMTRTNSKWKTHFCVTVQDHPTLLNTIIGDLNKCFKCVHIIFLLIQQQYKSTKEVY